MPARQVAVSQRHATSLTGSNRQAPSALSKAPLAAYQAVKLRQQRIDV
jgi:hypothetical protein